MLATSTQEYLELLEKTNQQLSFWYLPYELAIGFLTLAIAVLTIGFSFMLWRQSVDYKKKIDELIKEQKSSLQEQLKISSVAVMQDGLRKLEESAREATGELRAEKERALELLRNSVFSSKQTTPALTDAQIQAVLSLLLSYGADRKVIETTQDLLRGMDTYFPESTIVKKSLSKAQIDALATLLETFGANQELVGHVYSVLLRARI